MRAAVVHKVEGREAGLAAVVAQDHLRAARILRGQALGCQQGIKHLSRQARGAGCRGMDRRSRWWRVACYMVLMNIWVVTLGPGFQALPRSRAISSICFPTRFHAFRMPHTLHLSHTSPHQPESRRSCHPCSCCTAGRCSCSASRRRSRRSAGNGRRAAP